MPDKVGAGDLNLHDCRGTAATLLAEGGATTPEVAEAMTWTVEKAHKVIDLYLARRGTLAAHAIRKVEDVATRSVPTDVARTKIVNRLQTGAAHVNGRR